MEMIVGTPQNSSIKDRKSLQFKFGLGNAGGDKNY